MVRPMKMRLLVASAVTLLSACNAITGISDFEASGGSGPGAAGGTGPEGGTHHAGGTDANGGSNTGGGGFSTEGGAPSQGGSPSLGGGGTSQGGSPSSGGGGSVQIGGGGFGGTSVSTGGGGTGAGIATGGGGNTAGTGAGGQGGSATPIVYGLDARPSNTTCVAPSRPVDNTGVGLQAAYTALPAFSHPVSMLQAPGDATRWYVVEKSGVIRSFAVAGNPSTTSTFVDIHTRVNSTPNEAGLLGMAFHPDFQSNHYVFLSYTTTGGTTGLRSRISRFKLLNTAPGAELQLDPDAANEEIFIELEQPYENHNGGNIAFGPDGYLYIGFGDGGSGGDPLNSGQTLSTLLGKMLRIDVDKSEGSTKYAIPLTNPFKGGGGKPEIFAWGFRNPWRWSFDQVTGTLWVGDVGQGTYEEIDRVEINKNYGWRVREGMHCYNAGTCSTAGLTDPVVEYSHSGGNCSVTGGYVYRGDTVPSLSGSFIFGDYCSGILWKVVSDGSGGYTKQQIASSGLSIGGFGQGADGEVYVLNYGGGTIHRFVETGTASGGPAAALSDTGCVQKADPTKPADGMIPFDLNMPLWSDGASKSRWLALPNGTTIHVESDGDFTFPKGTVLMKQFSIGGTRVETRLFVRHDDGGWAGYSYRWNNGQTDATLLEGSDTREVGGQTWYFPSRNECTQCHTSAAGSALGPEIGQLNRDFTYPATGRTANQLDTLEHIGIFDAPLSGTPDTLMAYPTLSGPDPLQSRAKAYLHANCSGCHRPGGTTQANMDWRYQTSFASAQACGQTPTQGDLGVTGAKLILPGDPSKSILSVRMHAIGTSRMPPVGTSIVHSEGTSVIDSWISSLSTCP